MQACLIFRNVCQTNSRKKLTLLSLSAAQSIFFPATSSTLSTRSAKMQFANVGMAVNTEFDVNIKGSAGELNFNGYADLVQIDGQWYLTNYSIPLYSQE